MHIVEQSEMYDYLLMNTVKNYITIHLQLDRCVGSCNTLNNLSNKVCVPKKTKDLNLYVLIMITGITNRKKLTKLVSCKCKCKFDGRKCSVNQNRNYDKCRCECKRPIYGKDYIWNPGTCSCKNGKYLAIIIDNSEITWDEIIDAEETKTILKNIICETKIFYIFLVSLLNTIALLLLVFTFAWWNIKQNKNIYSHRKWKINKCTINVDSNDELKEIDIKNDTRYYFDDIITIEDFNLNNFLRDEKPYENVLVYNVSYESLTAKLLRVRFDKIHGFIRVFMQLGI